MMLLVGAISRTFLLITWVAIDKICATSLRLPAPKDTQPLQPYALPYYANSSTRAAAIARKRTTFLYGPSQDGGPYSPAGPLGEEQVRFALGIAKLELDAESKVASEVRNTEVSNVEVYHGLQTVEDYITLYDGSWNLNTAPVDVDDGLLTNFTQDLLFSMERLSFNPYAIRRLKPTDSLPYEMGAGFAENVTGGSSLNELLASGHLFYIDHRFQGTLPRATDGKYAPACDAYFYLSKSNGDLLPLSIRSNTNNTMIYTPLDLPNDWLLAKMMFNVNDFFMGQFYHLASTHYVTEIVFEAAIRTLSDNHPILALLTRIMYSAFGIRPLAASLLFAPGAAVDQYFGYTGPAAATFSNVTYFNDAGAFRANYFWNNLKSRGLVDTVGLPAIENFPFRDDAAPIYQAFQDFMTVFIYSYYEEDADIARDNELQSWLIEANGPAGILDFPTRESLTTRSDLVDVLVHMAHLVSTSHHTVNLNQLFTNSAVLPFHPTALYKPVPISKNVSDVASFLPPLEKAVEIIDVASNFARPLLAGTNLTLTHMFDNEAMLARMNHESRQANLNFMAAMTRLSQNVSERYFDENGLSQGMPFVWKALDPNVIPWSMSI